MKLTDLTKEQKDTYVGLLTEVQKDELIGQWYAPDSYFNPIQDVLDFHLELNLFYKLYLPTPYFLFQILYSV